MSEPTSTQSAKPISSALTISDPQTASSIGAPLGKPGTFEPSIFNRPARLQAESLAAFLTSSELEIRPVIERFYEPFRLEIRYEIEGSAVAAAQALDRLTEVAPPGDNRTCRDLALLLIAKTKSRPMPDVAQKLQVADFVRIMREYPLTMVRPVIEKWDEREGEEAIFTPSSAELRRALDEVSPAFSMLRRCLVGVSRGTVTP